MPGGTSNELYGSRKELYEVTVQEEVAPSRSSLASGLGTPSESSATSSSALGESLSAAPLQGHQPRSVAADGYGSKLHGDPPQLPVQHRTGMHPQPMPSVLCNEKQTKPKRRFFGCFGRQKQVVKQLQQEEPCQAGLDVYKLRYLCKCMDLEEQEVLTAKLAEQLQQLRTEPAANASQPVRGQRRTALLEEQLDKCQQLVHTVVDESPNSWEQLKARYEGNKAMMEQAVIKHTVASMFSNVLHAEKDVHIVRLTNVNNELKEDVAARERDMVDLRVNLNDTFQAKISQLTRQMEDAARREILLDEQLSDVKAENGTLVENKRRADNRITVLLNANQMLQGQLDASSSEALALRQQLEDLSKEAQARERASMESQASITNQYEVKLAELSRQLTSQVAMAADQDTLLAGQLQRAQSKISELASALASTQQHAVSAEQQLATMQQRAASDTQALTDGEAKLLELSTVETQLQQALSTLQAEHQSLLASQQHAAVDVPQLTQLVDEQQAAITILTTKQASMVAEMEAAHAHAAAAVAALQQQHAQELQAAQADAARREDKLQKQLAEAEDDVFAVADWFQKSQSRLFFYQQGVRKSMARRQQAHDTLQHELECCQASEQRAAVEWHRLKQLVEEQQATINMLTNQWDTRPQGDTHATSGKAQPGALKLASVVVLDEAQSCNDLSTLTQPRSMKKSKVNACDKQLAEQVDTPSQQEAKSRLQQGLRNLISEMVLKSQADASCNATSGKRSLAHELACAAGTQPDAHQHGAASITAPAVNSMHGHSMAEPRYSRTGRQGRRCNVRRSQ